MARAKRHYVPDQIWHITQRCHKREFLLKFKRDRYRWIQWLFEAKRRFGLVVLNYVVTSNHIHLIVKDDSKQRIIPQAIGLVAGRTAQEFNRRKRRKGAFWEDRYHSTAIETGEHLLRCMVYIDLNMVRARVVDHPSKWSHGGYNEIQTPGAKMLSLHTIDSGNWQDLTITNLSYRPIASGFKMRWEKPTLHGMAGGQKV